MTREELDNWNICLERPDARVMKDVIFDYFENLSGSKQLIDNHTCENCKHIEMTYNSTTDYKSYYCTKVFGISKVQLDFYCNRWEGKE